MGFSSKNSLVVTSLLLLSLAFSSSMYLFADEKNATIKIKNESTKTVYIVLDDYNQGEIWSNYSCEYKVSFGEHKVEVYCGDDKISRYITVSQSYPDAEWCITDNDF